MIVGVGMKHPIEHSREYQWSFGFGQSTRNDQLEESCASQSSPKGSSMKDRKLGQASASPVQEHVLSSELRGEVWIRGNVRNRL